VEREIELTRPVRARADHIINTTGLSLTMLQHLLSDFYSAEDKPSKMIVNIVSFGYKYGIPIDADLVFDVRFLPNPYYLEELRPLTGLDRPVAQYVFDSNDARSFMAKVEDLLDFLLPLYVEEGKLSLLVAVGCTGGRHRSVAIAAALTDYLKAKGISAENVNRDIKK
jgi:UPF0042 nucleotide-binding protein